MNNNTIFNIDEPLLLNCFQKIFPKTLCNAFLQIITSREIDYIADIVILGGIKEHHITSYAFQNKFKEYPCWSRQKMEKGSSYLYCGREQQEPHGPCQRSVGKQNVDHQLHGYSYHNRNCLHSLCSNNNNREGAATAPKTSNQSKKERNIYPFPEKSKRKAVMPSFSKVAATLFIVWLSCISRFDESIKIRSLTKFQRRLTLLD